MSERSLPRGGRDLPVLAAESPQGNRARLGDVLAMLQTAAANKKPVGVGTDLPVPALGRVVCRRVVDATRRRQSDIDSCFQQALEPGARGKAPQSPVDTQGLHKAPSQVHGGSHGPVSCIEPEGCVTRPLHALMWNSPAEALLTCL